MKFIQPSQTLSKKHYKNIIQKMQENVQEMKEQLQMGISNTYNYISKAAKHPMGFYLIWVVSHYVCVHLYVTYCAPYGFKGFLTSFFMTSTHVCHGLSWIIYEGGNLLFHMWVLLGGWIMTNIIRLVYQGEA